MCLPDFVEFKKIAKKDAIIGYRNWKLTIKDDIQLKALFNNYVYVKNNKPVKVLDKDSGYYNYYYNNNNYNNYYYNNNNNYNYYEISGITLNYGKVAIHKSGTRSQYCKIKTLFTIRESDAIKDDKFKVWIKLFNQRVIECAKLLDAGTIHYQDFIESIKNK